MNESKCFLSLVVPGRHPFVLEILDIILRDAVGYRLGLDVRLGNDGGGYTFEEWVCWYCGDVERATRCWGSFIVLNPESSPSHFMKTPRKYFHRELYTWDCHKALLRILCKQNDLLLERKDNVLGLLDDIPSTAHQLIVGWLTNTEVVTKSMVYLTLLFQAKPLRRPSMFTDPATNSGSWSAQTVNS